MNDVELRSLIEANPAIQAKVEAGNHKGAADDLNARTAPVIRQYQLTTTDVMDLLGPVRGTEVMTALRAIASMTELVRLMDDRAGANIAHRDADAVFASLVSGSVITSDERDQILALRNTMTSLAEQALGHTVHHLDIARAWAGA